MNHENVKAMAGQVVAAIKQHVAARLDPLEQRIAALEDRLAEPEARPAAIREGQIAAAVENVYNEAGRRLIPTVCMTSEGAVIVKMVEAPPEAPRPWPTETTITERDEEGRAKTMLTKPIP